MLDELQLETVCPECRGEKGYGDNEEPNGWVECRKCRGAGLIPTETGMKILNLVRHNSRVKLKAELCVAGA